MRAKRNSLTQALKVCNIVSNETEDTPMTSKQATLPALDPNIADPRISRKAVEAHLKDNCPQVVWYRRPEVFRAWGENPGIRIVGKDIDRTFKSTKAAKCFLTKLNNKILYDNYRLMHSPIPRD